MPVKKSSSAIMDEAPELLFFLEKEAPELEMVMYGKKIIKENFKFQFKH